MEVEHERVQARINCLADEVARLYTFGHNVVQTAQCAAKMEELRQAETNKQWSEYSDPPPTKSYLTCG